MERRLINRDRDRRNAVTCKTTITRRSTVDDARVGKTHLLLAIALGVCTSGAPGKLLAIQELVRVADGLRGWTAIGSPARVAQVAFPGRL
jgi:hypothetical protein